MERKTRQPWEVKRMSRKLIASAPIVAVAALLLSVGTMSVSTASSADPASGRTVFMVSTGTTTVAHYQDGYKRGTMSHTDDGDKFRVCDTRADGHGVVGIILRSDPLTNDWSFVRSEDDGGDSTCDSFTYDIKGGETYKMRICWKGAGLWDDDCTDKYLYE